MNGGVRQSIAISALLLGCWLMLVRYSRADTTSQEAGAPAALAATIAEAKGPGNNAPPPPLAIDKVMCVDQTMKLVKCVGKPGLNDWLAVVLNHDISKLDLTKVTLILNGGPIPALPAPRREGQALLFHLVRNSDNRDSWKPILGSPWTWRPEVVVKLQVQSADAASQPRVIGGDRAKRTFHFVLISGPWLLAGIVALLVVGAAILTAARSTNLLRDSLLPQLPAEQQTYSLGRCQMAFWFALVFAAFVFLLLLLSDYNTVTTQALILMGLSGATAIFAVQIDASKDTEIGAANETLRALGLKTYEDVRRLDSEINERSRKLNNKKDPPSEAEKVRLLSEIVDRQNKKRTFHDLTSSFVSEGWYRDLTTDVNGAALHRLQVFYWTLLLGVVFIVAVYRELAMPQFSDTLLALMGVTNAGYLGFKYPERQS